MSEPKKTKKGTKRTAPRATVPSQFRLSEETKADLDLIAATRARETGMPHTRTDAVRVAARLEADRIRKACAEKS